MTDAFGGYGGISQYNRDLLLALSQSSRIGEIVALPRLGHPEVSGLPPKVRQLPPSEKKAAYVLAAYKAAKRLGPFDLIFCGHINASPLSALLGFSFRLPVWLQTHGIDAWECPSGAVRFATERSALITTVSRYTRGRLLQWANIDPAKVRVLPNTVRAMFTPGPPSEAVLSKYGLTRKKIILTVSRLTKADKYKGHSSVIQALPEILEPHPDIIYVIVGDGDGRAKLESLVSNLGLQSCVKFLGRISDNDVLALYRSSSVFIMPSTKEGFGIVFVEAAAAGLPVIGGNRDGSTDALADGSIGRLINPRSRPEIIAALSEALANHPKSAGMEVARFSFPNFATHVDELVRHIVH